jgi:hypothetical protein
MIIEKVDPARESFSDFSLDETILTIGDIPLDLQTEESDQEVIITLGSCNGAIHRGLMPRCTYVADVIIPPRKYDTITIEGENEGEETTELVPLPLDTDTITLRLWPIVDEAKGETNNENENEGEKENGLE